MVGAVGTPAGITPADAAEGKETPTRLVAVTVNVYVVLLVSAKTVHDVVAVVQNAPPGDAVTVYSVTAAPLSLDATHETVA